MTDVAFAGGVLAGAILVGAAWYGRFVWRYRPVDEQEVDRQQAKGRNHQILEAALHADIEIDLELSDRYQGIHPAPGDSISVPRTAIVTITGREVRK